MGNDALADHLRAHAEKYPYLCTESEQTFSQTCDASSSAAPGSEAIPYKCKMCDKSFICELLKHLNQSDKRIYKCSICSKPFIHLDGHVFDRTKPTHSTIEKPSIQENHTKTVRSYDDNPKSVSLSMLYLLTGCLPSQGSQGSRGKVREFTLSLEKSGKVREFSKKSGKNRGVLVK